MNIDLPFFLLILVGTYVAGGLTWHVVYAIPQRLAADAKLGAANAATATESRLTAIETTIKSGVLSVLKPTAPAPTPPLQVNPVPQLRPVVPQPVVPQPLVPQPTPPVP